MDTQPLRLAFVGDVCLPFLRDLPAGTPTFGSWPAIREEIGMHDFLVGNLECCLVDERCGREALSQSMATPATAAAFLQELGFTDLCLANNHAMDCGIQSLAATREWLASAHMRGFGAGADLREAEKAVYVERNGRTVAFLGACDKSEFYAADTRAGVAPMERQRLGARVREAASQADLVVMALHADLEFSDVPGRWRQRLSRWLVEQGAHLVIQHHPHVLQGIEAYRGGLIAYSLGNFIFRLHGNSYQQRQAGVFDSMILVVDADLRRAQPALRHRVIPLRIADDHLPHVLPAGLREDAEARMQALSSLVTGGKGYRRAWFGRARAEGAGRTRDIYYALRRGDVASARRALRQLLTCREDWRWMQGLASLGYL